MEAVPRPAPPGPSARADPVSSPGDRRPRSRLSRRAPPRRPATGTRRGRDPRARCPTCALRWAERTRAARAAGRRSVITLTHAPETLPNVKVDERTTRHRIALKPVDRGGGRPDGPSARGRAKRYRHRGRL